MTRLDLSNNCLGRMDDGMDTHDGTAGVVAIGRALASMEALTSLNVGGNNLATSEVGAVLGRALARNTVLQELDLSGRGYFEGVDGEGFACAIARGVRANEALTSLALERCDIRARGAKDLAEALARHVSAPGPTAGGHGRTLTHSLAPSPLLSRRGR